MVQALKKKLFTEDLQQELRNMELRYRQHALGKDGLEMTEDDLMKEAYEKEA